MEPFKNKRCPCVFVTVRDNLKHTLQFVNVETGQTHSYTIQVLRLAQIGGTDFLISFQGNKIVGGVALK